MKQACFCRKQEYVSNPCLRQQDFHVSAPYLPDVQVDFEQAASKTDVGLGNRQVQHWFGRRTQVQDSDQGRQNTLLPGGIGVESGKKCIGFMPGGPD